MNSFTQDDIRMLNSMAVYMEKNDSPFAARDLRNLAHRIDAIISTGIPDDVIKAGREQGSGDDRTPS
jgi:hypothetical protein